MDLKKEINSQLLIKYPELCNLLLIDQTSKKNIKWCTDNYEKFGKKYSFNKHIEKNTILEEIDIIKPRILKSLEEQRKRSKDNGEVFTPSWICEKQNKLVDKGLNFSNLCKDIDDKPSIINYIKSTRLEMACGESPYICTRYDAIDGIFIEPNKRVGFLDKKLQLISKITDNENDWFNYAVTAFQNSYGFDYQGDNVLISRLNLIMDFIDFYKAKFNKDPDINKITTILEIISWNIWQMDGLKFVIPDSCHSKEVIYTDLLGEEHIEKNNCVGCETNNHLKHNGVYCYIMDWNENRSIKFVDLIKGKL